MSADDLLSAVIDPPTRDLGDGFLVQRALPSAQRRMVGPFVFFDRMGPTELRAGTGLDVRPHPHIGLATVTYLLRGELMHRDSLGSVQMIRPGAVNWMIAGRGIAHSERTDAAQRQHANALFGVQTWIALPRAEEERAPSFDHHTEDSLPVFDAEGARVRVIAGSLLGHRSPVATISPMFYAHVRLQSNGRLTVPAEYRERALYLLQGDLQLSGSAFRPGQMLVLRQGVAVDLSSATGAELLLLGGEPLEGPRHVWWNFVSSSTERIEQAKHDWRAGRFAQVPGETEFIPLPEQ